MGRGWYRTFAGLYLARVCSNGTCFCCEPRVGRPGPGAYPSTSVMEPTASSPNARPRSRSWPRAGYALALAAIAASSARANPGDRREPPTPPVEVEEGAAAPAAAIEEPEPERPGRTPPVENAGGLAAFAAALDRTAREGAITRVVHLGDSSIGMDGLPHGLRQRFQRSHGDAGPGFVLMTVPSPSYRNRTVDVRNAGEWHLCFIIRRCRRDGHYGLGGVTAEARGRVTTTIEPRDGRAISRAELWYLAQPGGGRLRVELGDRSVEVDTDAPALEDRWEVIEREPGPHPVSVRSRGGGPTRAFGVVLENEGPGVVWDTLGMVGAFTHRLLAHDEDHFARQLGRRDPDLVVLGFGGNDLRRLVNGAVDREALAAETEALLSRVRRAAPEASCLVVGVNDHTRSGAAHVSPRHVEAVLAAQRDAATRAGCAFWSTTEAMGGAGSFATWLRHGMASSDGKHLNEAGRQVVAARLHAAIMHAIRR